MSTAEMPQHLTALSEANAKRIAAASIRHALGAGRMQLVDAIMDERAGPMKVHQMVKTQPGWGDVRARALLENMQISEHKRVRDLTRRQALAIVAAVDPAAVLPAAPPRCSTPAPPAAAPTPSPAHVAARRRRRKPARGRLVRELVATYERNGEIRNIVFVADGEDRELLDRGESGERLIERFPRTVRLLEIAATAQVYLEDAAAP